MNVTFCPPGYAYGYASPGEIAAIEADTRNVGEPFGALAIMRKYGNEKANRYECQKARSLQK
jgi:hypothetical protein